MLADILLSSFITHYSHGGTHAKPFSRSYCLQDQDKAAHEILSIDKAQRKKLYEELGIPLDFTVED